MVLTTTVLTTDDILSPATSSLMATYMYGTYVRKYTMPAQAAATFALEYNVLTRKLQT